MICLNRIMSGGVCFLSEKMRSQFSKETPLFVVKRSFHSLIYNILTFVHFLLSYNAFHQENTNRKSIVYALNYVINLIEAISIFIGRGKSILVSYVPQPF